MHLHRVWLHDFRSYEAADVSLAPGLTVLVGDNGTGKTNLLEAIGYLSSLSSFRGVPTDGMVRMGADRAVVRGEVLQNARTPNERTVLIESELVPNGRNRVLLNKQPLPKTRALRDILRVSVFSPDDLVLVKGGPGERRNYLDEVFAALHLRNDALLSDLDRIVRQRNALLKQSGGRLSAEIGFTLDVWDAKLASTGAALCAARFSLVDQLRPALQQAYTDIADRPAPIDITYNPSWSGGPEGLAAALEVSRNDDVRRGLTLVGPHRDDVLLRIEGRPSRTHASQGEQRTLALSLRLASHRLLTAELEAAPVLLLDDVFSELDPTRSDALVRHLPPGQSLLATAGFVPPAADVQARLSVSRSEGVTRLTATPSV
jgi:DNA replication and repair protein RecF